MAQPPPPALVAQILAHGGSVKLYIAPPYTPLEIGQFAALAHQHNARLELKLVGAVDGGLLVNVAAAGQGNVAFDFT